MRVLWGFYAVCRHKYPYTPLLVKKNPCQGRELRAEKRLESVGLLVKIRSFLAFPQ